MDLKLRKLAKFVDKTFIEGGKKASCCGNQKPLD